MEIPTMMKAAVIEAKGKIVVKQVPVPEPGYGEILIKIITSGVCHTDLHAMNLDLELPPKLPLIPGHEGAGIVAKLGPGCKTLKIGDRVGNPWLHDACGSCDHCLKGEENVCSQQHQTGYFSDGCFAEYTVALENFVGRIPDEVPFVQASPLMCAGVTTYKGLKMMDCEAGQWIAIHGAAGGLGHMSIQIAVAMGFKVLAIDFGEEKINDCLKLGAKAGVDASKGDVVQLVREAVKEGVHGVVVIAPALEAYKQAFLYVRPRGTVVGIGLPPGIAEIDVFDWVMQAKTLRGSIVGSRADLNSVLALAVDGAIHSNVQEDSLDNIATILDKIDRREIRGRIVLRIAPDP